MTFQKDILLVDFEGLKQPIQLGAVLMDRETLAEKDSYVTYVAGELSKNDAEMTGITPEVLASAPTQAEVGRAVLEKFGTDVLLACWVANLDMAHLKTIITAAGGDFEKYDYHVFDIWPAAYAYLLARGYEGSTRSEDMFRQFGEPPREKHDGLQDCRLEAAILRKILSH